MIAFLGVSMQRNLNFPNESSDLIAYCGSRSSRSNRKGDHVGPRPGYSLRQLDTLFNDRESLAVFFYRGNESRLTRSIAVG